MHLLNLLHTKTPPLIHFKIQKLLQDLQKDSKDIAIVGYTKRQELVSICVQLLKSGFIPVIVMDCLYCPQRFDSVIPSLVSQGCRKSSLVEITGRVYIEMNMLQSFLIQNLIQCEWFYKLRDLKWCEMSHRGGLVPRLISVQGEIRDGIVPIYRHPADSLPQCIPFTPQVNEIRLLVETAIEKHTGIHWELNHVLVQYYRSGLDYISEHSDKSLDIVPGSWIVNVSFGCTRTMTVQLKTKDQDTGEKASISIPMTNGSCFLMDLETNRIATHTIKQDKRLEVLKTGQETDFGGERISLTFRTIGTFLTDENDIYGQGATSKSYESRQKVSTLQVQEMLHAFHQENKDPNFDWQKWYGAGFNCIDSIETL